ncbi:MAG: TAXI family TRAP transporter solute-binding subunit [Pseudonocardiales bacterium]|nr:TAXI family TRAP transporter solute-binding subunit [Pseudonocardiales bacterium]
MTSLLHRRALGSALVACAILSMSACGSPSGPAASSCQGDARPLVIATGNATGVYAALGDVLAGQITASTPMKATAIQTGSTLRNVQQLSSGEYDVAFAQADSAADAVRGQGVFAEPQKLRALARVYSDYVHVVATKSSGIKTMADFRGKRISTGSSSSGTELIAGRLLTAAGLDPKRDVTAQSLDLVATVAAIKAGSIDGFVWSGGLPTGGVADLFASSGAQLDLVDASGLLASLQKINSVYAAGTIPAGVYGTAADVPAIEIPNLLVVRDDFPANDACAITKTLLEKKADLVKAVPAATGIDPRTALDTAPLELNPGSHTAIAQLTTG